MEVLDTLLRGCGDELFLLEQFSRIGELLARQARVGCDLECEPEIALVDFDRPNLVVAGALVGTAPRRIHNGLHLICISLTKPRIELRLTRVAHNGRKGSHCPATRHRHLTISMFSAVINRTVISNGGKLLHNGFGRSAYCEPDPRKCH